MGTSIYQLIEDYLDLAIRIKLLDKRDLVYMRNQYYLLLDIEFSGDFIKSKNKYASLHLIIKEIFKLLSHHKLEELGKTDEQREAKFINLLIPPPSVIESKFSQLKNEKGIKAALQWFYSYSSDTNYIKLDDIAKNKSWLTETFYGKLQITINLSKPEKDPAEIAKAKQLSLSKQHKYPKCLLCLENEGFSGNLAHPARHNHRMLKMNLNNQDWFFQYSPYLYYPEHSIIINKKHTDMIINQNTFQAFFDFVDQVPHYIIGSNSDIPIVGGSILSHDHFQAGNHIFPIELAKIKFTHSLAKFPNIQINYLNWPITTLQLVGNKADLLELSEIILDKWYHYANPKLNIIPFSEKGVRHNAITPILRKSTDNNYQLYFLLRNNRTNKEFPDGIFHPHKNLHHIKKENIGLIEAMGLAILPGRLAYELAEIERLLSFNDKNLAITELLYDEQLLKHEEWLSYLYDKYNEFNEKNTWEILQDEVGYKFSQVLEDAGVFKLTRDGEEGVRDFLNHLSLC